MASNPVSAFVREIGDVLKLFDDKNKKLRRLVVYSEKDIYYQYFEGLLDYILENSKLDICYITSDCNDPIFKSKNQRIKAFYIRHSLSLALSRLDSKVVLMTMPDLDNFFFKRSPSAGKYVYKFHAIVSTHQQYRPKAFDAYDTIFLVGPHHLDEIRKTESTYNLPVKNLIKSGYHRLEKIYRDHQTHAALRQSPKSGNLVLIAPSWGPTSLFENHLDEVVTAFEGTDYDVRLRPHPQSILTRPDLLDSIRKRIKNSGNIKLESDLLKQATIHEADVLVTDRSGIAYEYAFGTERPVLFIDTPLKLNNPQCNELSIEPLENFLRNEIGVSLSTSEIGKMPEMCQNFQQFEKEYHTKIIQSRERWIYNWLESTKIEGDYILSLFPQ